jgi:hypothetical protein
MPAEAQLKEQVTALQAALQDSENQCRSLAQQLEEQKALYQGIIEAIPSNIFWKDLDFG